MLKGGQPVTVNLKWKVISLCEVDVEIDSIIDDTTGATLTENFSEAEKKEIIREALADFYKVEASRHYGNPTK